MLGMLDQITRERARQRLQLLAKEAVGVDDSRLPNQLSAFAMIVQTEDVVLIQWVRTLLEDLWRDSGQKESERARIVDEARTLVHDLLKPQA